VPSGNAPVAKNQSDSAAVPTTPRVRWVRATGVASVSRPEHEGIQCRDADQRAIENHLQHAVLLDGELHHGAHHRNSTAATSIQSALIGRILESRTACSAAEPAAPLL